MIRLPILAALLTAQGCLDAPDASATPARLELMSTDHIESEFRLRLIRQFHHLPGRFALFGDVGPTNGCGEISRLADEIVDRDAERFQTEFLAAAERAVPSDALTRIPQASLPAMLRTHYSSQIEAALDTDGASSISNGAIEILQRMNSWAAAEGLVGQRLGYNSAGQSYWEANDAIPQLVCALSPQDRPQLIAQWQKGITQ